MGNQIIGPAPERAALTVLTDIHELEPAPERLTDRPSAFRANSQLRGFLVR